MGEVLATIADSNRVNQRFFKKIEKAEEKPWIRKDSDSYCINMYMFLSACETTGLQKNVANLKYNADGVIQIAL